MNRADGTHFFRYSFTTVLKHGFTKVSGIGLFAKLDAIPRENNP
jgi:hypothetical protein